MVQYASPSGKTLSDLLSRYNLSYGRPNDAMKRALIANSFDILRVNTWPY